MNWKLALSLLAIVILFGCLAQKPPEGTPSASTAPITSVQVATTSATPTATGPCAKPDVSFGTVLIPTKIFYGTSYDLDVEVMYSQGSCPNAPTGATLGLYDGKRKMTEIPVTLASGKNSVKISLLPEQTRAYSLALKLAVNAEESDEANNEYKFQFTALPFGFYEDISGNKYLEATSTKMYAQGFAITEPLPVKDVELLLRKSSTEYESFDVFVQIRPDAGGKPSGANELSLSAGYATLPQEYGWMKFTSNQKTTLRKGTYWLIVRTVSVKPPVQLHMIANATFQKPEFSMRSFTTVPFNEDWQPHAEGAFNFRFTNDEVPVLKEDTIVSPHAFPSGDIDPYGSYS